MEHLRRSAAATQEHVGGRQFVRAFPGRETSAAASACVRPRTPIASVSLAAVIVATHSVQNRKAGGHQGRSTRTTPASM